MIMRLNLKCETLILLKESNNLLECTGFHFIMINKIIRLITVHVCL